MKKIQQIDCIELLKSLPNNSVDLIFTDPPYNLSTQWVIDEYGKPNPKTKAIDFMGKWDGLNGKILEEWFKEANRVLKYGGRVLMFGMDRQIWVNCYYANLSGLVQQQSLYWYFASSMPKAADLSKMLVKHFNMEREVIGKSKWFGRNPNGRKHSGEDYKNYGVDSRTDDECNIITKPSSELAQKYDGFKYSISPLKQTNETIMVFQKPYKTGSCLHDTLAYENGDEECCCGALNIDDNRIQHNEVLKTTNRDFRGNNSTFSNTSSGFKNEKNFIASVDPSGRFPSQCFVDSETAKLLDEQSGISKSTGGRIGNKNGALSTLGKTGFSTNFIAGESGFGDIGGSSKILHKCDYDEKDIELYYYCPKVDKKERNMGLKGNPKQQYSHDGRRTPIENDFQQNKSVSENNHPTVKPISLLLKILNLFKTPNPQVCVDTFAGSGSIPIAAKLLGFEVIAGDLDKGFVEISNARLEYAIKNKNTLLQTHSKNTRNLSKSSNEFLNEYF